jgi:alanyl-tRNA synthetase
VNELIRENLSLQERRAVPIQEAQQLGAMMLFGEKYGEQVRVIQFGKSIELCGGTHTKSTGSIALFKITSEGAVAAGIRRIEAVSAEGALSFIREELAQLDIIRESVKSKDIVKAIADLQSKNAELQKQIEKFNREKAQVIKSELLKKVRTIDGIHFLAEHLDLEAADVKDIAFQLKSEMENLFAVFGSESAGKPTLTCIISENIVQSKQLNASTIVRDLAKDIQGGGGGQAFFATAGGSKPEGLASALKRAASFLS